VLDGGAGLAGQDGLIEHQVRRAQHAHVGRYHVAGRQPHDVAGDDLLGGNLAGDRRRRGMGAAQHGPGVRNTRRVRRVLGVAFRPEPQQAADGRERADHHRVAFVADQPRDRGQGGQHEHEPVAHHGQQRVGPVRRPSGGEHVLAVCEQTGLRLGLVKPAWGGLETAQHAERRRERERGEAVPGGGSLVPCE
jgi:hypothetical protein